MSRVRAVGRECRGDYPRAMALMAANGVPAEVMLRVLKGSTRKNGSINVAALERDAEDIAAAYIVDA